MYLEILLFFTIALVYSSAGFGGGSMYIAVLSQTQSSQILIKTSSLICNAGVTANGSIQFYRSGWIAFKPTLLLLAASVPFCIWTSTFILNDKTYFLLLAACLLIAALAMAIRAQSSKSKDDIISNKWWHFPASAIIGAIAGLTGIGGGVYLSPLLHISGWGSPKHIAAVSSLYILVNSISSIITRFFNGETIFQMSQIWLLLAALAGGFLGSRMGTSVLSQKAVKWITVIIIIFAAIKLIWDKI
ncbi:MAG: sulfite exporter TauE/SafE family protein [Flavobacteriales bacterium]